MYHTPQHKAPSPQREAQSDDQSINLVWFWRKKAKKVEVKKQSHSQVLFFSKETLEILSRVRLIKNLNTVTAFLFLTWLVQEQAQQLQVDNIVFLGTPWQMCSR